MKPITLILIFFLSPFVIWSQDRLNVEGDALPAGKYTYSLLLDGAVWQSLPMVLTR